MIYFTKFYSFTTPPNYVFDKNGTRAVGQYYTENEAFDRDMLVWR